MRKPVNMLTIPQGGWHCRFPDGFEVNANHPSAFLRECYQHLVANEMDSGTGWQDRMWDLVCETHPEMECSSTETPERTIGPDDVKRFLRTIWETWKSGAEPVSVELQNQRIDTCLKCPLKSHTACFGGCSQLSTLLSEFAVGRDVRNLPEIHKVSCGACGCYLETKTMFPIDVLKTVDQKLGTNPQYWEGCWMLSEATSPPVQ